MTVNVGQLKTAVLSMFAEDLPDRLLTQAVNGAAMRYSRYNPLYTSVELSLVDGQRVYDAPDDLIVPDRIDYWPGGEVVVTSGNELWSRAYNQALATAEAADKRATIYRQGTSLVVDPTPQEDKDVDFWYYGRHQESSGAYDTIPDMDYELVLRLVLAEVLEMSGTEYALSPDTVEGLLSVKVRHVTENVQIIVRALRKELTDRYGGY